MGEWQSRTATLLGEKGVNSLSSARVAIFGIGGVGGYATEALARAGVGEFLLVDSDTVTESNINRQIIATRATVGKYKTEAARERILSINPEATVKTKNAFFSKETRKEFDINSYDYVIDAIDSVASKVELIVMASEAGVPIISAMGAGNKLDPTAFEVADISKTTVCPLARAVRVALRKRGINHLKVVYSRELPREAAHARREASVVSPTEKRTPPGSVSFVPSVMGLILAGEVIKEISGIN